MDLWLYKAKVNGGNKDISTIYSQGDRRWQSVSNRNVKWNIERLGTINCIVMFQLRPLFSCNYMQFPVSDIELWVSEL